MKVAETKPSSSITKGPMRNKVVNIESEWLNEYVMLIHPVLIEQIKKGQEYTSIYTTIYNNRAGVIRQWLTLTFGFKN